MRPIPKLPLAPPTYEKSVMDRLIKAVEQALESIVRPGPMIATSLRLTGLPGANTISVGINAVDTSVALVDATNFPTTGAGLMGAEKFSWDGKTGNTLDNLVRGIAGTTAAAHLAGVLVVASAVTGTVYAHPTTNALYLVP